MAGAANLARTVIPTLHLSGNNVKSYLLEAMCCNEDINFGYQPRRITVIFRFT